MCMNKALSPPVDVFYPTVHTWLEFILPAPSHMSASPWSPQMTSTATTATMHILIFAADTQVCACMATC